MTIDTSPSPPTTTTNKLFLQQQIPAQINQLRFLPVQQRTNSSSIFSATDKNDIYNNDENTKMVMRRIKIALGVLTEGCCKVGFCSILASNSSAAAGYTMNKGATEFDQITMKSNINWTCCRKRIPRYIAHISHNRHNQQWRTFFKADVLLSMENAKVDFLLKVNSEIVL